MKQVAVAIIHGMGIQKEDYAEDMEVLLQQAFLEKAKPFVSGPFSPIVIESVYWAEIFGDREEELFQSLVINNHLRYKGLRRFVIQYLADVIAYQPVETAKHNYHRVHQKLADVLRVLAGKAGHHAPLCVISHSLGSVIASNYFYDLQINQGNAQLPVSELSPLEKGDSLALFYTLGTTLPLWSLRYDNFDRPIQIPSHKLHQYYPNLEGEWINFYDKDDILSYPLKQVSPEYNRAVNEDREINAGDIWKSWNPLSHSAYLTDKDVIEPIVNGLFTVWAHINNIELHE
ncbi:chemotaxis protein [Bacillus songklensis]|uniref:Chemotaxis protein n=1 Tax=Bacillus songklensis TaxID=1069116 RepID=A0ABV8AZX1_9BACI